MANEQRTTEKESIIIRKYANRRLYNTATATFVTLDDLRQMVVSGEDFTVIDAQTGNDITASVLAQIVAEQENRGESLLPLTVLKQAISFYEKGLGTPFSRYLEQSMATFTQGFDRMGEIGEIGRRNFELFQRSLGMFAPGTGGTATRPADTAAPTSPSSTDTDQSASTDLRDQMVSLKDEIAALQRRLDTLGEAPKPATRTRKRKERE